ncbi:MAG: LysR family transcriptional regulator [Acidimicrobiia bacterium]
MELRQIRHFEAVYRLRSISRAAEEQHLTQSALSRSIKALEAELGQPLFDRSTHAVAPTPSADELVTHAIDTLAAVRSFEQSAAVLNDGDTGTVRLGTGAFPLRPLITTAIRTVSGERPNIKVKVTGGRPGDLVAAMVRRELDAVVCDTSKFESVDARTVTVEPLAPEPLVIVVGAGHPLAATDPGDDDVARHPWALPPVAPASLRHLPASFRRLPAAGFPRYELDSVAACLDLVRDQRSVTMTPLSVARADCAPRGLVFRLAGETLVTRDGIHVLRARTPAKPARLVLDAIAGEARHLAGEAEKWRRAATGTWTSA